MPTASAPHQLVCLALPGILPFDLATACESFRMATGEKGEPFYQVTVCAEQQELDAGPYSLKINHDLATLDWADTVVVPGIQQPQIPVSANVVLALQRAADRGARIASICTGSFVLAQAGLLDGRGATTHWRAAAALQQAYPRINVDPKVLFVDNGQILTSAGAAAGLDLCLHMIRIDCGAAVASQVARLSVVPLQREGGQAQFIPLNRHVPERSLQALLAWAMANLHQPLTLNALALKAHTSPRTLHRRFQAQFGQSPTQWLTQARIQRAQELLERSTLPIERIVEEIGLGSSANFRIQFQRVTGVSPGQYRKNFGSG